MIIKSSKLSEVKAALATLKTNKVYSVQEIIDTVLQVCNHKNATYANFRMKSGDYHVQSSVALRDLYVDLTYQRKIRLAKIITKLLDFDGFCKNVAGTVDVAYRPSSQKRFVWDGFRRCLMVGMCNGTRIGVHEFEHPKGTTERQARIIEAEFFKVRNADKENMSPEEIFKACVVYEDPRALAQLALLKKCSLDIEGLNDEGVTLGGFRPFEWCFDNVDHDKVMDASEIIRLSWPKNAQVLAYLLGGLSKLLQINDNNLYTQEEVLNAFVTFAVTNKPQDLTNPRLNSKPFPSIALNTAKKVLQDKNGLIQQIHKEFSDDEVDSLF